MANSAEIIAEHLFAAGCRHAFGIPGGEVLALVKALNQVGIEFHLAKHENCAGFMGEGVYHADGAPAILVATLGPGVANAVNVVANALQDRVPMIFLTGCIDPSEGATYTHQVFDHNALLSPVTKASLTMVDGASDAIIDKALAICTDGRPGPVHIDVPISVATREQDFRYRAMRAVPAALMPADGLELETARDIFASATKPIIIAGLDVLNQGAESAVSSTAINFGIPVVTTYKAKGVLSEEHALALGAAGLSPLADRVLLPVVAESDCIILAGYDPIEMRSGWRHPWKPGAPVVEFSAAPNTHYMHQSRFSFLCDITAGLAALTAGVTPKKIWADEEPALARKRLLETFAADGNWNAAKVVATAREVLPENTIATADTGAHRILLSQMWRCYEARTLLQSSGLCTMGCALPLAIGQKIAGPGRPVVAFTGDAGLEMFLGELATVRDMGLAIIVVVFVDASLALIELKQRALGHENAAVDFGWTDFAAVANALGGTGIKVDNEGDYRAALEHGMSNDGFTLIACEIGRQGYDGRF